MSLVALTGCPNAGTQPPVGDVGASASPSATASAPTAESSAPTTTPSSDATPGSTPSSSPLTPATVSGKVYNEAGSTVSSAKVRVRSLNSASPFDSTVDVTDGAYVVNSVPAGVQVEITASKDGWTSRSRVESLLPNQTSPNVVNFGGQTTTQDPNGQSFFISNFPEVSSASSSYKDGKLTWTLRFSEPLDSDNRSRVSSAISVSTTKPGSTGESITIQSGSLFLSESNQATVTWDTTNTIATLSFNVVLVADKDKEKQYALALTRAEGDDAITDAENKVLGLTGAPAPGRYSGAFKLSSPQLTDQATAEARWTATHTATSTFDLPKDETDPTLTSVTASPLSLNGTDYTRLSLTFSEPMQAYSQIHSATLDELTDNYIFAVSDNSAANIDMSGTVTAQATAMSDIQLDTPFRFSAASNAVVRYSTTDAKVVFVDVPRSLIPIAAKQVKVRVNNVEDPAGNANATGNSVSADKTADNIKIGNLK